MTVIMNKSIDCRNFEFIVCEKLHILRDHAHRKTVTYLILKKSKALAILDW